MPKRPARGMSAWFDRTPVDKCPSCEAEDPDPTRRGFCASCGALFRDKLKARWQLAQAAAVLGAAMACGGAVLALYLDMKWVGVAVFAVGLAPLGFGLLSVGRYSKDVLAALELRSDPPTMRLLSASDRWCATVAVVFVSLLIACMPYYTYVEAPRQRVAAYQTAFGDAVQQYAVLVTPDAVAPEDAVAHRVGKLLVLERSTEIPVRVSSLHSQLPENLRAANASEVGTVAMIDWVDHRTGWYGEREKSPPAYRVDAHVTLLDAAKKALIARIAPPSGPEPHDFKGGEPPGTAPSNRQPGRGPKAEKAVLNFLTTLPIGEGVPPTAATPPAAPE